MAQSDEMAEVNTEFLMSFDNEQNTEENVTIVTQKCKKLPKLYHLEVRCSKNVHLIKLIYIKV